MPGLELFNLVSKRVDLKVTNNGLCWEQQGDFTYPVCDQEREDEVHFVDAKSPKEIEHISLTYSSVPYKLPSALLASKNKNQDHGTGKIYYRS